MDPVMDPVAKRLSEPANSAPGTQDAEAMLLQFSELLFFAYRDFTGDPDAILQDLGFGRAHHRVLHFVNRQPGLRVADLLEILNITKQSLGRVLRQLVDQGYIRQEPGSTDRRERLLYTTEAGALLAKRLAAPQLVRFAKALEAAGPGAEAIVRRFLEAMANDQERPQIEAMLASDGGEPASCEKSAANAASRRGQPRNSRLRLAESGGRDTASDG